MPSSFGTIAATMAGLALASLAFLVMAQGLIRRWVRWLTRHPRVVNLALSRRLGEGLDHFFEGLATLQSRKQLSAMLTLSVLIWGSEVILFALVAEAVMLSDNPMAAWFSCSTASLAVALPSAPAFVGTFDYFGALGAVAYGVDWSRATAFIVLAHVVLMIPFCFVPLAYVFAQGQLPSFRHLESQNSQEPLDGDNPSSPDRPAN